MLTPIELAIRHHDEIASQLAKVRANAGCIRQLLLGRVVVRRSDKVEFVVTESRLGLSGTVTLHGKRTESPKARARASMIGGVRDIDIVEPVTKGERDSG